MKKTMFVMLLALTLCLSACTQENRPSDNVADALTSVEQTVSVTTPSLSEKDSSEGSAAVEPEKEDNSVEEVQPQPDAEKTENTTPAAEPEQETASEPETTPAAGELSQDDILVEFEGKYIEPSNPFRLYTTMWTITEDNYYAIAPGATFTVTNGAKDETTFITITLAEYIRCAESFISIVNHDGEMFDADMLGQFWSDGEGFWLSDQVVSDLPAGNGLYWAINEKYDNYSQVVTLYPGQSVSFRLPEREQDTIYRLNTQLRKEGEEFPISRCSFMLSADDISVPLIAPPEPTPASEDFVESVSVEDLPPFMQPGFVPLTDEEVWAFVNDYLDNFRTYVDMSDWDAEAIEELDKNIAIIRNETPSSIIHSMESYQGGYVTKEWVEFDIWCFLEMGGYGSQEITVQ